MKGFFVFFLLLSVVTLLGACQSTDISDVATIQEDMQVTIPTREVPFDISNYDMEAGFTTLAQTDAGNLFEFGNFEAGLASWTGCSEGAIEQSFDAFDGNRALFLNPGNCFYRSTSVKPGDDMLLTCYAKVTSGTGWTGMGLGFADSSWTTTGESAPTVITASSYTRYDVRATAPANSSFVSMWFYSDNPVVVDACSLTVSNPPPPSGDNFLINGGFESVAGNPELPTNWSLGCGANARSFTGDNRGGKIVLIQEACFDQSLSADKVAALSGQEYVFSCFVSNNGFASLTIFFNGQPITQVVPDTGFGYERITISGTAPQGLSSVFVSIYGNDISSAAFDDCSLVLGSAPPPPPPAGNLLENGLFQSISNPPVPDNWSAGCGGTVTTVGVGPGTPGNIFTQLRDGACLDQSLSSSDVAFLSGRQFTFSCFFVNGTSLPAIPTSGYAAISIFFDGTPVTQVVPIISGVGLTVAITGVAPTFSSGFVSIYADEVASFDVCELTLN